MEMIEDGEAFRAAAANDLTELEMLRRRMNVTYTMGARQACIDVVEKLYAYFDKHAAILLLGATLIGCA